MLKPSMILAGALATTLALPAMAEDKEGWSGKGELGVVVASGNTDTTNANAKLDLAYKTGAWKHAGGFQLLQASSDGNDTADRWEARWQTDYSLSDHSYLFGALRYEQDRFSSYDWQDSISVGYGHRFIDSDRTKLRGQIGLGYREFKLADTGEKGNDIIARGDVYWETQLTETTKIVDTFSVEAGEENTFLSNNIALVLKINGNLGLSLAYDVRHNTDVTPDRKKTDTITTVNLVYGF
jgi:putative salt-induced outer membrane protein